MVGVTENRGIGRQPLNWRTRLSIIKGMSRALNFLHQSLPSHKVPHGNLKSSNVLIHLQCQENNQGGGDTYQCKVTDYGLYPLLPCRKSSHQKLAVGMYAPEFLQGKKLTAKADIYCFGILLLEIITGKAPAIGAAGGGRGRGRGKKLQQEEEEEGEYYYDDRVDDLSGWVRRVVDSDWSTDILDVEILAEKEGHDEMLKLTNIALDCTAIAPENRPNMTQVLTRIDEVDNVTRVN